MLDELPLDQGFAHINWEIENNPWAQPERASKGYIAQEIEKRIINT